MARSSVLPLCPALLPVVVGCSLPLDETNPPPRVPDLIDLRRFPQDSSLFVGRWAWRRSTVYGPGEPGTSTPETTGRTETLVFPSPDSVHVYRNDTLDRATTREAYFSGYTGWGVRNDSLVTTSVPVDGPETVYTRVE